MKVAFLTTDNREQHGKYDRTEPSFGTAPEALLSGFEELGDEVEVHVISCSRRPMTTPRMLGKNIYFHQTIVPKLGWGRTAFLGCAMAARKVMIGIRPDVIHGQGTERDCAVSMMLGPEAPRVLTIHGCMSEMQRLGWHQHRLYGWLASVTEKFAARTCDGVFCNSTYTRSLMEKEARRTWLVPNALRPGFFRPSEVTRTERDVPVLVNIGLLSPYKRQLEILRMVGRVVRSGHPVSIRFAGHVLADDGYAAEFRDELAGASSYAEHVGSLKLNGVIDFLDGADGAVHFPAMETFGLVVAEALSRGLKFFGSSVGGVPDVAEGVVDAELHESLESLEHSLIDWLGKGAPKSSNAATVIRERFSPLVVARQHLEIYQEIVSC